MTEQVTTLERLVELADEKRSVCTDNNPHWMSFKHKPAAFIIHMSGYQIYQLFKKGLFVYEKEEKKK